MRKGEILRYASLNAIGTVLYVTVVVFFIYYLNLAGSEPDDRLITPIAMLMLFVFSAALTGFLVFGRPIMWYLDGRKSEALLLLVNTLGIIFAMTILVFLVLIAWM